MMRYVMIAVLLIGFNGIAQQTKVGTIDVDFILSKMPELEVVQKGVEDYGNSLQVDLDAKMAKLKWNTKLDSYVCHSKVMFVRWDLSQMCLSQPQQKDARTILLGHTKQIS